MDLKSESKLEEFKLATANVFLDRKNVSVYALPNSKGQHPQGVLIGRFISQSSDRGT